MRYGDLEFKIVTPDTPLGQSEVLTGCFESAKRFCEEMALDHGFSMLRTLTQMMYFTTSGRTVNYVSHST